VDDLVWIALLDQWLEGREYGCFQWKTFIYHTGDFCRQPCTVQVWIAGLILLKHNTS